MRENTVGLRRREFLIQSVRFELSCRHFSRSSLAPPATANRLCAAFHVPSFPFEQHDAGRSARTYHAAAREDVHDIALW